MYNIKNAICNNMSYCVRHKLCCNPLFCIFLKDLSRYNEMKNNNTGGPCSNQLFFVDPCGTHKFQMPQLTVVQVSRYRVLDLSDFGTPNGTTKFSMSFCINQTVPCIRIHRMRAPSTRKHVLPVQLMRTEQSLHQSSPC